MVRTRRLVLSKVCAINSNRPCLATLAGPGRFLGLTEVGVFVLFMFCFQGSILMRKWTVS